MVGTPVQLVGRRAVGTERLAGSPHMKVGLPDTPGTPHMELHHLRKVDTVAQKEPGMALDYLAEK